MSFSTFSAEKPAEIAERLLGRPRRVLVYGEMGVGKSTLVAALARHLADAGTAHRIIGADPGSPAFGVPGAVCAGRWQEDGFKLLACEALCSLNAGRFRLPLIHGVQRLIASPDVPLLLIDAPGVTRGVAGAELLTGLIEAAAVDTVLLVAGKDKPWPMRNELNASGVAILHVMASERAHSPSRGRRIEKRTMLWDAHLSEIPETWISLDPYHLVGTPPPIAGEDQWRGRQIALLERGHTIAMGEILAVEGNDLRVRIPEGQSTANQLLVRDAARNADGFLTTVPPLRPGSSGFRVPADCFPHTDQPIGPRPVVALRRMTAVLINGILGDPLLHLRLHNRKRSLLFDLGEGSRLPAKIAHQVSDVFISHAHLDHISGFLWLLRSRIGELSACRVYGPPGLARHIAGLLGGIHWDRIGDRGPVFEVFELNGDRLDGFRLQAGAENIEQLGQTPAPDGLLVEDAAFTVRAATLDHGIPVLALAFQQKPEHHVSRQALEALGLSAGPWVGELKQRIAQGETDGEIVLPDGRTASVADLAEDLLQIMPGEKLVYATDLADTPANRRKLTKLASGAHTLFCEAAFLMEHRNLADSNGHLTARACGEIAAAAGVRYIVPFHLSKRYDHRIEEVLAEVRGAFPATRRGHVDFNFDG